MLMEWADGQQAMSLHAGPGSGSALPSVFPAIDDFEPENCARQDQEHRVGNENRQTWRINVKAVHSPPQKK